MAHHRLSLPNAAAPYGGTPGNENEASGHPVGQNAYEDGYGAPQVCHLPSISFAILFFNCDIMFLRFPYLIS